MRILWVKMGGFWPPTAGGRLRSFHIVGELSQRHRVSVITTHARDEHPDEARAALPQCERVLSFAHDPVKRASATFAPAVARSWLSPLPVDLRRWRSAAVSRGVSDLLAADDFDLCIADFLVAVPNLPMPGRVPVALFEHNVEHMIWKRLRRAVSPVWRPLVELEWRKLRRFEARACARARLTIAVSEEDRALLAALCPAATVRAISTGVDAAYFAPRGDREVSGRLVFTGAMDWYPNEDAVLHFIDEILPAIRSEMPNATLTVVGRNPSARVRAAGAQAGVQVTGTVDDVRPHVEEAEVFVVPYRVGGGTRLKLFEGLAMAKATVSTTVGAEGLPLVPGTHFERADDPREFARAVVALLGDPDRRRALGAAGRRLVSERHSWARVADEFEAVCAEAADESRTTLHSRPADRTLA